MILRSERMHGLGQTRLLIVRQKVVQPVRRRHCSFVWWTRGRKCFARELKQLGDRQLGLFGVELYTEMLLVAILCYTLSYFTTGLSSSAILFVDYMSLSSLTVVIDCSRLLLSRIVVDRFLLLLSSTVSRRVLSSATFSIVVVECRRCLSSLTRVVDVTPYCFCMRSNLTFFLFSLTEREYGREGRKKAQSGFFFFLFLSFFFFCSFLR